MIYLCLLIPSLCIKLTVQARTNGFYERKWIFRLVVWQGRDCTHPRMDHEARTLKVGVVCIHVCMHVTWKYCSILHALIHHLSGSKYHAACESGTTGGRSCYRRTSGESVRQKAGFYCLYMTDGTVFVTTITREWEFDQGVWNWEYLTLWLVVFSSSSSRSDLTKM